MLKGNYMKRPLLIVLIILLSFILLSCSTIKVDSVHDPKADFSALQTYKWHGAQPNYTDIRLNDAELQGRIKKTIDAQLAEPDLPFAPEPEPEEDEDEALSIDDMLEDAVEEETEDIRNALS